ncbi:MAG: YchF family ATPase [Polyangiaceae bacterium]|nr:YchF family ATPase [Polyangiaceae bacterium]
MRSALVGYAQTGKTTLFNALTGQTAVTGAGRGDKPNLGVIKVPDPRVDKLTAIYKPRRTVFAEVRFVDVPGPRTKGGGLSGSIMQSIKEDEALTLVIRGFVGADGAQPDPVREMDDFEAELLICDQIVVEKRLEKLRKEHSRDHAATLDLETLEACLTCLSDGKPLRLLDTRAEQEPVLASYGFASRRPMLAVLNVAEDRATLDPPDTLVRAGAARGVDVMSVCASIEAEIAGLASDEQGDFLESLGLTEAASARFVRNAYGLLDYISFFTVGPDEVRAWTTRRGDRAPRAAGRVHSDMERGFIRAEVMKYEEFMAVGSEQRMKELGKLRVEGKNYVVEDGDILNFRFNV